MMILKLIELCRRMCEERYAEAKARLVRTTAVGVSHAAAFLFTALFVGVGVIFLGAALTLLLAAWFGSLVWALFATGIVVLLVALAIWSCRARFMHRSAIRGVLNIVERKKI